MKKLLLPVFMLLFTVISCSKGAGEEIIPVSGIQLNKHEMKVERGGNDVLAVTITPSNATDKTVTWVSTDPGVATVSDGIVIGVKTGTTEIIAKSGNYFDKCVVSVVVSATAVKLSSTTGELKVGDSFTLHAYVLPEDTTDEIEWSSSNDSVATVDNGDVMAISKGEAVISAKVGELIATCKVLVIPKKDLEGTWGLIHHEYIKKEDGKIVANENYDANPFSPSSHNDWKLMITHLDGDKYIFTFYYWNSYKIIWERESGGEWVIQNGETYIPNGIISFRIESGQMTMESFEESMSGQIEVSYYTKNVFARMDS